LDEASAKMFGMADYKLPAELAKASGDKDAEYKFIFIHPNGLHLSEIKEMIEDDKIKPIIDKVYPFSESIEAFEHLATGRAKGKIVVKIS
jgi:NADPH:quinone reductase-like Zn-dependent oxidoreductase